MRCLGFEVFPYFCGYVLRGESEFLFQHFVGCAEAERFEAEHMAAGTYQSLEGYGKAGSEAEYAAAPWQEAFLIVLALTAEKAFACAAHYAASDSFPYKQCGSIHERAYF